MTNTNSVITGGNVGNINDWFAAGNLYCGLGQTTRGATNSNIENNTKRKAKSGGTIQYLGVLVQSSNTGAHTTSWVTRINGATGNGSVTLGGSVTGWQTDNSHTDTVSAGDTESVAFVGTSGAPDCFICNQGLAYNATTPVSELTFTSKWQTDAAAEQMTGSSNLFIVGSGGDPGNNASSSETAVQQVVARAAGTYSGLQYVITTCTTGCTGTLRHNGADGNQTVSPTTTAVAAITQDGSHSDTIAATDTFDHKANPGGSAMNVITIGVTAAGTTSAQDVFAADMSTGGVFTTTDQYQGLGGALASATAEANSVTKTHNSLTATFLRVRVGTNSKVNSSSFEFRNALASGNQSCTFGAATNGTVTDTSHSDTVAADAAMDVRYVSSAGAGTLSPSWIGVTLDDGSNGGAVDATGTGSVGTITLTAATGSATAGSTGSGSVGTITLSAPAGVATAGSSGIGGVGTITLSAPTGGASVGSQAQVSKEVAYGVVGGPDAAETAGKVVGYALGGGDGLSAIASKIVAYAVLGPPPPRRRATVRVAMYGR